MLPALAALLAAVATAGSGWQFAAIDEGSVPPAVLHAAAGVEIAVIDTGADLTVPEIAARRPLAYDVQTRTADVRDANGHGTFVTSIAAAYSGDARLLVVKAGSASGAFTDDGEAVAIHYAVAQGARIINLSIGGPTTSNVERAAIRFAVAHGVLVVTAAGNDHAMGNPVQYPAALLQPVGSNGSAGAGLVVAAAPPVHARLSRTADRGSRSRLRASTSTARSAPASTATAAAPRSPPPRSPARPHSSGRPTPP